VEGSVEAGVVVGFDLEGLRMVYFVVMRVYRQMSAVFTYQELSRATKYGENGAGLEEEYGGGGEEGRCTVEGRAWRRRVDCVSHDWAVSRYGMSTRELRSST
jgi:hypothetical protein